MNKIQRVSHLFRLLFLAAIIIIPIAEILFWINAPLPIDIMGNTTGIILNFIPSGIKILHTLTPTEKLFGFLISMIPTVITVMILYFLIKLFGLYEKGEIFSINNVSYIKKIAYALLIGQLLNPIYEGLLSATMTIHNPHGYRYGIISFSGTNVCVILLALLIILISWIMAEGCKLREEQQLTV